MGTSPLSAYNISWVFCITYLLLWTIIMGIFYGIAKRKIYFHYWLYCTSLLIYLLFYHEVFAPFWNKILQTHYTRIYFRNFNRFVQILFYSFYVFFIIDILNIKKRKPLFINRLKWFLHAQLIIFTLLFVFFNIIKNSAIYEGLFTWWFIPVMAIITFILLLNTKSNKKVHRVIILGTIIYTSTIGLALFYYSNPHILRLNFDPVTIVFIGILIENLCFTYSIAINYKAFYKDTIIQKNTIRNLKNEQRLAIINGTLEGANIERSRIANDLHNGLGNLIATASIQFEHASIMHSFLKKNLLFQKGMDNLDVMSDKIRDLSHEMMTAYVTDKSLTMGIQELVQGLKSLKIDMNNIETEFTIPAVQAKSIYITLEELFIVLIKSNATNATITITNYTEKLIIEVIDNREEIDQYFDLHDSFLKNINSYIKKINAFISISKMDNFFTRTKLIIPHKL